MANYGLGDYFKRRTKKAISLTPGEKSYIKKQVSKVKSTPKYAKKYGSQVDFGRLYGFTLNKPSPIKRKKVKATKTVMINGIQYKKISKKKKR